MPRIVEIPLYRRILIVGVTLVLSALLFRDAIAVALVTRGDGFLQKGQTVRSLTYYRRALWFDGGSELAADRFAFAAMMARRPQDLRDGIAVSSSALKSRPGDVTLLTDRGLLYQLQRAFGPASSDFASAARQRNDARLFHFAAWASFRARHRSDALLLWQAALRADSAFRPARVALARFGSTL